MAENIILNRTVFNKGDYTKTINTSFTELDVKPIQEQIDEQPTVQEFFNMYNELFYEINELGPTNSHEYLIKTSTEYVGFEQNNEIIEALQREIAQLREELLETQQELSGTNVNQLINPTSSIDNTISVSTPSIVSGGGSGGGGGGGGY